MSSEQYTKIGDYLYWTNELRSGLNVLDGGSSAVPEDKIRLMVDEAAAMALHSFALVTGRDLPVTTKTANPHRLLAVLEYSMTSWMREGGRFLS